MQSDAYMKTGHLIKKKIWNIVILGVIMQQTYEKSALLHTMLLWAACTAFFEKLHVFSILSLHSVTLFCTFLSGCEKTYVNNDFHKNCIKIINIFYKISHF